jgi:hypothetical protein
MHPEFDIGSPAWYAVQFGAQKSNREMLFGPFPSYQDYRDDHYDRLLRGEIMNRWESVKSQGKHVYWRYGSSDHHVGYVAKNTADNPPGQPFCAGIYPQPYRFGQRIGWYRTVADAKRAVETRIAGPAAQLLDR